MDYTLNTKEYGTGGGRIGVLFNFGHPLSELQVSELMEMEELGTLIEHHFQYHVDLHEPVSPQVRALLDRTKELAGTMYAEFYTLFPSLGVFAGMMGTLMREQHLTDSIVVVAPENTTLGPVFHVVGVE